jgi:hypothetical protein
MLGIQVRMVGLCGLIIAERRRRWMMLVGLGFGETNPRQARMSLRS